MGEKTDKYCDLCAARIDFAHGEVVLRDRTVAGHATATVGIYQLCESCNEQVKVRFADAKAAADAKWDRKAPTTLDVSL